MRPFSVKAKLGVADDPVDGLRLFDEGDSTHLASAGRTKHRIQFVDLADHLRPAIAGHMDFTGDTIKVWWAIQDLNL